MSNRIQQATRFFAENANWLFVIVVLIAVGLRVWGLDYGLPYIYHPDESVTVTKAQAMLKTGDLNPHFFHWPSLIFYLNAFIYALHYIIGKLMGVFATPADIPSPVMVAMGAGHISMSSIWLLSRALTMSMGVGSVILIFLSGRKLTGNTAVGLIAALMLAISPTNVAISRHIIPDTFTVFFIMLSFYGSVSIFIDGKPWHYILTGIAIGLTASTKYNGVLISLAFIVAYFFRHGLKGIKNRTIYLAAILSIATFLATTPYAILDYPTFLTDLQFDAQHYSIGHAGMEGNTLNWYLSYLWRIEGPVFIIAILGIVRGIYNRSREMALLAIFPLFYFAFISSFVVRNDRTLLPVTPFLFLFAASSLVFLFKLANQRMPGKQKWLTLATITLAIVTIAFPLQKTIKGTIRLTTVDSRETSRAWIAENLPPGSRIAIESYAPFVDPQRFSVQRFNGLKDQQLDWYLNSDFEYLVFSQGAYGRFYRDPEKYASSIASYEELFANLETVKIFNDGGYEVRIYAVPQ